jgi:hypothetical protein
MAAAFLLEAVELITIEKPGKPMYRTKLVKRREFAPFDEDIDG